MTADALVMAIWRRGKPDALLHHSDRGSQYTSEQFQRLMADNGVVCSMSRSGNVWDPFMPSPTSAHSSIAGGIIVFTTAATSAFSQQTITPNGNYNFNYGPLDDKTKLKESTDKSDPNSPGFHFSIQSGQTRQFGFHSFQDNSNAKPPDLSRPLGNGD